MPTRINWPQDATGANETIDYVHHEIHNGSHYTAFVYEADVDAASTLSLLITASSTKFVHLVLAVQSTLAGSFTFSEAPNASGGTSVVAYNNRRPSAASKTATTTVTYDPTFVSAGTILLQAPIGTSINAVRATGGGAEAREEWILSKKFLLTEPVAPLPGLESGVTFKPLKERPIDNLGG